MRNKQRNENPYLYHFFTLTWLWFFLKSVFGCVTTRVVCHEKDVRRRLRRWMTWKETCSCASLEDSKWSLAVYLLKILNGWNTMNISWLASTVCSSNACSPYLRFSYKYKSISNDLTCRVLSISWILSHFSTTKRYKNLDKRLKQIEWERCL